MTIESLPVLLTQPQFANAPNMTGARTTSYVAAGQAPRVAAYHGKTPLHSLGSEFLLRRRQEIDDFEDFFNTQAGQWAPFWIPSWAAELNPLADALTGSTSLSITPVNYATVFDPSNSETNRLGHYIFLLNIYGQMNITKVDSVSGTSPEVLALQTAVANDMALGTFIVGFLYQVRFAQDTLVLDYTGPTEATAKVGVLEVAKLQTVSDA